jgi:hypothetical protein
MTEYKIIVSQRNSVYEEYEFMAVFDGYDGAPIDHETPSQDKIGWGDTEIEAIYNLLEKSL